MWQESDCVTAQMANETAIEIGGRSVANTPACDAALRCAAAGKRVRLGAKIVIPKGKTCFQTLKSAFPLRDAARGKKSNVPARAKLPFAHGRVSHI